MLHTREPDTSEDHRREKSWTCRKSKKNVTVLSDHEQRTQQSNCRLEEQCPTVPLAACLDGCPCWLATHHKRALAVWRSPSRLAHTADHGPNCRISHVLGHQTGGSEPFAESSLFRLHREAEVDRHAVQAKANPIPTNHHHRSVGRWVELTTWKDASTHVSMQNAHRHERWPKRGHVSIRSPSLEFPFIRLADVRLPAGNDPLSQGDARRASLAV